jgi:hypothetical protein
VKDLIQATRIKEFPGVAPRAVYETLVGDFVGKWEGICLIWFTGFRNYALAFINSTCEAHFGAYKATGLYDQARLHFQCTQANNRLVTEEILDNVFKETQSFIKYICDMESRQSFILNEADYIKMRQSMDYDAYSDGAETESFVIANVLAYFEISSKRLIEIIPMICDTSLSLKFVPQLETSFLGMLGIVGPLGSENSEKYLRETSEIRERRQRLRRQLEIVNRAEQILTSVNH